MQSQGILFRTHALKYPFDFSNRFTQIFQRTVKLICMHTVQVNTYTQRRQSATSTETVIRAFWPDPISCTMGLPEISSEESVCGFAET